MFFRTFIAHITTFIYTLLRDRIEWMRHRAADRERKTDRQTDRERVENYRRKRRVFFFPPLFFPNGALYTICNVGSQNFSFFFFSQMYLLWLPEQYVYFSHVRLDPFGILVLRQSYSYKGHTIVVVNDPIYVFPSFLTSVLTKVSKATDYFSDMHQRREAKIVGKEVCRNRVSSMIILNKS